MDFKSIDKELLLKHFSGDEEILLDMINAIHKGIHNLLDPIRESIYNQNADLLRINAHTFKGIMNSFYSSAASKVAHELEMRGQNSIFDDALTLLNELEDMLMLFIYEIEFLKKDLDKTS